MKILFATTNQAKVRYYVNKMKELGFDIVTLADLDISVDVEENGLTPKENAIIKAKEYARISGLTTISLDDGLFFENVPNEVQPGTNVRRINGKRLTDEEMIEHYIGLVNQYGIGGELRGYFLKGVAVATEDEIFSFEKKTPRCFLNKQSNVIDTGYPLASIQIISGVNKFKSELTKEEEETTMDIEQREIFEFMIDTIHEINTEEMTKVK